MSMYTSTSTAILPPDTFVCMDEDGLRYGVRGKEHEKEKGAYKPLDRGYLSWNLYRYGRLRLDELTGLTVHTDRTWQGPDIAAAKILLKTALMPRNRKLFTEHSQRTYESGNGMSEVECSGVRADGWDRSD